MIVPAAQPAAWPTAPFQNQYRRRAGRAETKDAPRASTTADRGTEDPDMRSVAGADSFWHDVHKADPAPAS